MIKKVKAYIEKYHMIQPGDVVVTGVSGGADSVCLLLMLQKLQREIPFRIVVVHVNHGIREDATQDAAYAEALAKQGGHAFYLIEEDVVSLAKAAHISVEEAGRNVRYAAFEKIMREESDGKSGKIAVAHNQNDRAETMLFHLFRGTGLNGLGSIRPVRDHIIRPILCLAREEIEQYLREENIAYCTDCTNAEEIYTRNKIRHRIIPAAETVCHDATGHMSEVAEIVAEAYDYIKESAEEFCDTNVVFDKEKLSVSVEAFRGIHSAVQKEILHQCLMKIKESGHNITGMHIRDIYELFERDGNREITLPDNVFVKREYTSVIFQKGKNADAMQGVEITVMGECDILLPEVGIAHFRVFPYEKTEIIPQKTYTKWFDYDKIVKSLVLRTRQTGDYLTVDSHMSKKSLKNYMIQEKIPKDSRNGIYVLADEHHILWVIGHRISEGYKVDENTKTVLQVQIERKES